MKITQKQVGRRIRALREEHGLSQEDLAQKLGVARQTIGQLEKGDRGIDGMELIKLTSLFSTSPEDLLGASPVFHKPVQRSKVLHPDFDPKKLKNLLLHILEQCGGKPNLGETVLYKLLYFIDFDAVEVLGRPMTGMSYIRLQYGPVPKKSEYEQVIKEMTAHGELKIISHEYYGKLQKRYVALCEPEMTLFSREEEEIINRILGRLSDMKAAEITHYVHGDVPWKNTKDGEIIDYSLAFLRELPYSRADHASLQESASARDILNQLGPMPKGEVDYYKDL